MNNHSKKPLAAAIGAAFATSLTMGMAQAGTSPFAIQEMNSGYLQLAGAHEGKCGEGKCGADCVKGKTAAGTSEADAKAECDKMKAEGKCGEGKCGGEKKSGEGKCGEGKCGGAK